MNDKKLTDIEIVKALEWLKTKTKEHCEQCHYKNSEVCDICVPGKLKSVFDYYDRLQAENEKLQKFKAYFDFYYGSDIEILGIDENGDTTSFDEFYNCAIANAESIEHHIAHIIKTAKAEAVTKFAKRLKCGVSITSGIITCENVDNLLKETVGEDNNHTSKFVGARKVMVPYLEVGIEEYDPAGKVPYLPPEAIVKHKEIIKKE